MQDFTGRRQYAHRRVVSDSAAAWWAGYAPLGSTEEDRAERQAALPVGASSLLLLGGAAHGGGGAMHSRAASLVADPLPRLDEAAPGSGCSSSGPPSSSGDHAPPSPAPTPLHDGAHHRTHGATCADARPTQQHDGTRLWQSLAVPRRVAAAAVLLLCTQVLVVPLVFSDAVTGDALWGPFARPGTYLNVEVVRAQGLPLRQGAAGSRPADDTSAHDSSDASLVPTPYVLVVTWPWSRSGEYYMTQVSNASRSPVWQESFTFDQSNTRARKVALWLKDASGVLPRGNSPGYARDDPAIGLAMIPVPVQGSPQVSVTERVTGDPNPGIVEGWWPIQGPPRQSESDYAHANAPPVGEIYARVSFAERRARSGYCEQVRISQPVAQPADSYSNLAFMLSGTHMLAVCASDAVRLRGGGWRAATLSGMQLFPVFSCMNGLTQYYVGAGSFLFHASMTEIGQNLDMSGVYMLLGTPMLYMMLRLGLLGPPHRGITHLLFCAFVAVGAFVLYQYRRDLEYPAGGSTNLVLFLIALLAGTVASWLWLIGSPPEHPRRGLTDGMYDELDALLALPPTPTESPGNTPPTTPHGVTSSSTGGVGADAMAAVHQARVQLHHTARWLRGLAAPGRRAREARTSDVVLPDTVSTSPSAAAAKAGHDSSSSPVSSPRRYASRRERILLALESLRVRSKPSGMRYRYCCAAVLCIAVAYACRQMDVKFHVACSPTGWFQLHAVWHVLAAASLYFLWVFMRSEAPPTTLAASSAGAADLAAPGMASRPSDGAMLPASTMEAHGSALAGTEDDDERRPLMVVSGQTHADAAAALEMRMQMQAAAATGSSVVDTVMVVSSPRALTFPVTSAHGAAAAMELVDLRSPRSRAASVMDMVAAAAASSAPLQGGGGGGGGRDSGGGGDVDAVVGVPPGTARAAAHLRTRSREVFGHDMV